METSKNIGDAILAYKELSGKSYSECAESLELARSTLKEYAAGRGNPNMSTLEHLANKMGVATSYLVCGDFSADQIVDTKKLLDVAGYRLKLPQGKRRRCAELLVEFFRLTAEEEDS